MNKAIRALQFFNRKVKFENYFYNISISKYDITFQGYYNSNIVKELVGLKFKYKIDKDYGYTIFERDYIRIFLT